MGAEKHVDNNHSGGYSVPTETISTLLAINLRTLMSHSTKIPLDLFQVIEEEFVTLHGTPAQDDAQTVNLADAANPGKFRSVTSTLDWSFHPSHIKDPTSLALDLVSIWDARNDAAKSRAVFDVNADESAQN